MAEVAFFPSFSSNRLGRGTRFTLHLHSKPPSVVVLLMMTRLISGKKSYLACIIVILSLETCL